MLNQSIVKSSFEICLKSGKLRLTDLLAALYDDCKSVLSKLPLWEKVFHIFWLLGPFILLIERSPADLWLTSIGLAYVARCVVLSSYSSFNVFWVKATGLFWIWCLLSAALSDLPLYSIGQAFIWIRFPLFAMASCFWLGQDRRFFYLMIFSIGIGLFVMCCILFIEVFIEGHKNGRLLWPYGDAVPGNYVAKVGLPVFTILVAFAVSTKSRLAAFSGGFALFTMIISVLTGERINFLIRACSGMLAGLIWRPRFSIFTCLILLELLAVIFVFYLLPFQFHTMH